MAFPAVLLGGAAGGLLARILLWFFLAKGAAIVVRIIATLGLAFFTYEWVLTPVISMVDANVHGLPPELNEWLRALGIYEVISIIVSAYLLLAGKRIFVGRSM